MERIICLLIGYVFGLFQTGYFYGLTKHIDIRKYGSGNAGTTNTLRTLGWKAGIITFFGDCMKSVLAVLAVKAIFAEHELLSLLAMYAGMGVVLGHNYPVWLGFKGGKGVASTLGMMLVLTPLVGVLTCLTWLFMAFTFRYSSLSALTALCLAPVYAIIWATPSAAGCYTLLALLSLWRHRGNIKRLLNGEESKINFKRKK